MADPIGISLKPAGSWRPKPAIPSAPGSPSSSPSTPEPTQTSGSRSDFRVTGMTCGNCARRVTEAARKVDGVAAAEADAAGTRLTVWWSQSSAPNPSAVISSVTAAGYPASVPSQTATPDTASQAWSPVAGWRFNLVLGSICTLPLMLGEWVLGIHHQTWFTTFGFVLATIALFGCGYRFAVGAWQQMKVAVFGMDLLVSLGASTAYIYSVIAWRLGLSSHLYFMECGAILTFISAGHWLEARVAAQAEGALRELMRLAPSTARRRRPDGSEEEVPIASLHPGDVVVLRTGDRVPTDAEVLEGEATLDEALLTGESLPVAKAPGSKVFAGTTNLDGRLALKVGATGEATALAQIILAVRRAQSSRANIQRLADRVSQIFVPSVILVAILAAAGWIVMPDRMTAWHQSVGSLLWNVPLDSSPWANALISAAAVLIVACPCAMGLATPAAIMAAANAASRRGILIRDGVALEKAGEISVVLFDKTGTLTEGKPKLIGSAWTTTSQSLGNEGDRLALAASLSEGSKHPLSRAVAALSSVRVELADFRELRGKGISARLVPAVAGLKSGATLRLGSLEWLRTDGVDLAAAESLLRGELSASSGGTVIGLAADDLLLGCLGLRDSLRAESREVLDELRSSGLQVRVVSGDTRSAAEAIGRELGLQSSEVIAEVRPEQKAEVIRQLQASGSRVAFVGDGINDGPALAQADLGIAVTQASDVARESADLVLLRADLHAVPQSLALSKAALRTIRQNLFWAFFYNVLAVPLAALGLMNPMLCAAAMGLSDILVIGNALRLLRWKP